MQRAATSRVRATSAGSSANSRAIARGAFRACSAFGLVRRLAVAPARSSVPTVTSEPRTSERPSARAHTCARRYPISPVRSFVRIPWSRHTTSVRAADSTSRSAPLLGWKLRVSPIFTGSMSHCSPVDGHSNVTEFDGWSSRGRGTAVPSPPGGMTICGAGGAWSVATCRSPLRRPDSLRCRPAYATGHGTMRSLRDAHESRSDHRCRLSGAMFGAGTIRRVIAESRCLSRWPWQRDDFPHWAGDDLSALG